VLADHLFAPEAIATVGDDFQLPVLATLLDDPYTAVRFVAARALVEHGDLAPGEYDFLAPSPERRAVADRLLARFEQAASAGDRPELLLPKGALDRARLAEWLARRDDRPIFLAE
jgi:HEAT repeat protein